MKLIFLLLLVTVPFYLCSTTYTVLGEIPRQGSNSFYPYRDGVSSAFYLDVSNIQYGYGVFFKISLSSGSFQSGTMYMGGGDNIISRGNSIELKTAVPYYRYALINGSQNYYFFLYKLDNFRYYYVAPPPATGYSSTSKITIVNTQGPSYFVLGDIDKFSLNGFTPAFKGLSQLFCLDRSEFPNEVYYYFKTTITNGNFAHNLMYYGASKYKLAKGTEVTLSNAVISTNAVSTSEYYFSIRRVTDRYLYIAPPPPSSFTSASRITVFNIYSINPITYKILGGIPKLGSVSFNPSVEGKYCAFYIKRSDIYKDNNFYFEAKLSNGKFEHKHMFYLGSDTLYGYGATLTFTNTANNVKSDSYDTFTIPQTSYNYLYFAPPPMYDNSISATLTVYNTDGSKSKKVAIGVGVGVAVFVIIVVILSIFCYKRRHGNVDLNNLAASINSISTSLNTSAKRSIHTAQVTNSGVEPIHLNATHY